jgi:aldose 1-epimerase
MRGAPDPSHPINLAQHSYYNIGGGGDVLDHELGSTRPNTRRRPDLIPDGTIRPWRARISISPGRGHRRFGPDRIGSTNSCSARAATYSAPRPGCAARAPR